MDKPVEVKSDGFDSIHQKEVVKRILGDFDDGLKSLRENFADRVYDLKLYHGDAPSELENLDKADWQSDRNLGLVAATCDSYQATLLATCYNVDTLHFIATESTDFDLRDSITTFTKWMVGKQECDIFSEVDDFIHNRITQGTSIIKISWCVWYEWVDLRIPQYDDQGKFTKYKIETKHKRFEKGKFENIDNLDDFIYPAYYDKIQDMPYVVHVLHQSPAKIRELGEIGVYKNVDDELIKKIEGTYSRKINKTISDEKRDASGISSPQGQRVENVDNLPCDILEWYGTLTVGGKTERYRCHVDPVTETLLSMKPLRKITRTGKYPFAGGALIRRPGIFPGKSLSALIAPVSNAFNNIWNQKFDFQYMSNVPFGFAKSEANFPSGNYKVRPGEIYIVDDPQALNVPNWQKSMAWAQIDFQILNEMLEKLTGAAAYFMSNRSNTSGTATRDAIINQKSEVRFGLWVKRIIDDVDEALTMMLNMYQDWAPSDLGDRIIGPNGKKLFENFSIMNLRGGYDVQLSPDIVAGSKTVERELALWSMEVLQNTVWLNPQINPRGNWKLVMEAAKKSGYQGIEDIMPPEPPAMDGQRADVQSKWQQIKQGQVPEIKPNDDAMALLSGIMELKQTEGERLEEEIAPLVDKYIFNLSVAMSNQMKEAYKQQMADQLAVRMLSAGGMPRMSGGQAPQPTQQPLQQPTQQPQIAANIDVGGGSRGWQ